MAKGKGFDPVADAQELSEHNINPYYWVNKVTSYTYARWMAERKLAVIYLPFYIFSLVAIIYGIKISADNTGESIWQLLFKDWSSIYGLILILFLAFFTLIALIMVMQLIFSPQSKSIAREEHKPEKKKKLPKHRKDYH